MTRFADQPFQRKLRFAILLATAVAAVLACNVFFTFEYVGRQRSLLRTVATLAQSTAHNSTAAIAFNDAKRAQETLESLRAEPQIVAATLYASNGDVLATFATEPYSIAPPRPASSEPGVRLENDVIIGVQPVIQGNHELGTLYVWASKDRFYDRMRSYAVVALLVLAATLVLAWVLSTALRNTLARPILELANTADAIAAGQDYSLRARQYGDDELGRLTAAFNTMLDRTQAAVAAVSASETQLRLVTDNAPVYLAQLDCAYRYRFVNRPYAQRFHLEPAQVIGRTVDDLIGAAVGDRVRGYMDAALRGQRVDFETELDFPALGPRWMHMVYVPERHADGTINGFLAVITDVTQRKQSEQQVAHARDEALSASRAKDDFLAALSHELRTPLNPVLLLASEASEDPTLPPETREDFETIRKHIELEARLIDDLLDLTAITRGKLRLERLRIDLRDVLRDAIATVAPDIENKRIRLVSPPAPAPIQVFGDPVRLQQVFWNVLKNAVKFTPPDSTVTLETTITDDRVITRISDTGIGLTPRELTRVFDVFSQGDHAGESGSHRFGGLGLGLAISKMVLDQHAGTIHAASDGPGKGATFTIELPLAGVGDKQAPPKSRPATASAPPPTITGPVFTSAPRAEKILLVEDHVATRATLERLLTRRHFRVWSAGSLTEARALAEQEKFDVLISDVGLPDGSGYDLMVEFRTRFALKGIALTGYGMQQDFGRSQAAGFLVHLTKPVRVGALDDALAVVLK